MKYSIFIITLFIPLFSVAQKPHRLKSTIDSFAVNGEVIAYQRSTDQELSKYLSTGSNDFKFAMGLMNLQKQLNSAQQYVTDHREINFMAIIDKYFDDVKQADPLYNMSIYDKEVSFYKKYQNPKKIAYSTFDDKALNTTVNAPQLLLIDSSKEYIPVYNNLILGYVKGYNLISKDDNEKEPVYNFTNMDNDILKIHYPLVMVGENPDLKIKGHNVIMKHHISGQFLTMVDVFNGVFDKHITVEEAKEKEWVGYGFYHGVKFTYMFAPIKSQPGYWFLTIWNRGN